MTLPQLIETQTAVLELMDVFGAELTGSRFFGYASRHSDWDLFVDRKAITNEQLEKLHYKQILHQEYCDELTESIWKHKIYPIHVQVTLYPEKKRKIRDYILQFCKPEHRLMGRAEKTKLWSTLSRLL